MRSLTGAVAIAVCWLGAGAAAQVKVPAGQRAIVDLVVNETPVGDHLVVLRDGDALVAIRDLEAAGLGEVAGDRQLIDGVTYLSLASTHGGLRFHMDEATLELRIVADLSLFKAQHVRLRTGEPTGIRHAHATGAFVNYAVSGARGGATMTGEFGANAGPALLTTTASWRPGTRPVPGLTSLTFDSRRRMRRVTVGETPVPGMGLSAPLLLAGISVSREFSLNPYFSRYPTPMLSAAVATPSEAEVYVDGRLVQRVPLMPGSFDVTGVPSVAGPGRTSVVVRDAFGREQEFGTSYYSTASLLARGLTDYQYALGYSRTTALGGQPVYRDPVLVARHRVGVGAGLTLGVSVEASRGRYMGTPSISLAARHLGQIDLSGSATSVAGRTGAAGSLTWSYAGRAIGTGFSLRMTDAAYAPGGTPTGRGRGDATAFVGFSLGSRISTTISEQEGRDIVDRVPGLLSGRTSLLTTVRLSDCAHVMLTLAQQREGKSRSPEAFVGLSIQVGPRSSALLGFDRRSSGSSPSLEVQQSRPIGEGFGYRIHGTDLNHPSHASAEYAGRHGVYGVDTVLSAGSTQPTFRAAGGIAVTGHGVAFTRSIEQGYAVVTVPGVEGVRVRLNNLEVGRTDRHGKLLVPSLLSNYGNRITIEDTDVPEGYTVPEAELLIAPPARGAANVVFGVARMHAASGRVVLDVADAGGHVIPTGGVLRLDGREEQSPIGLKGEFFFEQLGPGTYAGTVQFRGRTYAVTLMLPAARTSAAWVDLGDVIATEVAP
ncbi:MAG: fimbria/pilus outer membrane usher protein [Vicinamibacterales bacterium]